MIGLLARPITRRLSVGLLFVMTRKLNNDATMATVSAAFRDIWTTLENQDSLKIGTAHEELRMAVIRKLMDLVAEGTTDREELKRKVLKTVPLR